MRHVRLAACATCLAACALVAGCGDSSSLYGTPSTGVGGTGTGAGTGSTSTGAGGTGTGAGSTSTGAGGSSTGGAPCVPVGHDEDADAVDDACDICPSYADLAQADGDDDGLGDACEAPADPTLWQQVASFDPFVDDPSADWQLGDYAHAPDELQIDTPFNAGRDADWQKSLSGPYSVETTLVYEDGESGWAGVRFAVGTAWWACLVHRVWAVNRFRYDLGLWEFPGSGSQILPRAEVADVGVEPAGVPRRIRVHARPNGSVLCTYDDAEGGQGQVEQPLSNADGLVGLRAYDTRVRFLNFVVYQ